MNILYISKLTGNLFAGPNNSVPAQVRAQSKIDNVFWYNINNVKREEWQKNGLDCKNLEDFPDGSIYSLPSPFSRPDLVIFEELYCYPFSKIVIEVIKEKIPYIIIPRSAMTIQGQRKKKWKKRIGNFLFFNNMINCAHYIQYLSKQEELDSNVLWNKDSVIIPNGIDKKNNVKSSFNSNRIFATYIGRYEIYQKGLDILFNAISMVADDLRNANFILNLYGVDQENSLSKLQKISQEYGITDIISFHGPVFGKEKEKVLLESDVFVMTSRFEGMPMGMIEALSYGLPCLATKGTNLTDEILNYDAGWGSEGDVESVAKTVRKIILDKENLKDKSCNALRLAELYSWDSIAAKSNKIYSEIIK